MHNRLLIAEYKYAGLANVRDGLQEYRATGQICDLTMLLAMQAEACGKAGRTEEGLESLCEAFRLADQTGERFYEAELHRLWGELVLAASGAEGEANSCFRKANQLARQQKARSLELRAAASLEKLRESHGKISQVKRVLSVNSIDPA